MSTLLLIPKSERSKLWINENVTQGRRLNNGIEIARCLAPEIIEAAEDDGIINEIEIDD